MATSVVFPRVQFFANNGRPLIGGRIHTYVAGSSTRARTYKDAAMVQPNTNPIVLDARGEAPVYLAEGVEHKFLIEDANGALLMTQEPVYGAIWPNAKDWPSDATLSYQYMTDAIAAAGAIGPIKFYDTYAQAMGGIGALADADIIEVSQDETRAGARTRYKVQAGALMFVVNLEQTRLDLATPTGSALIGNGAETVAQSFDALQLADYTALRASTSPRKTVYVTGYLVSSAPSGIAGMFIRDDSDTTTADNGGTVIVRADGKRYKRPDSGELNVQWFGAKGDWNGTTGADDTAAIQATLDSLPADFPRVYTVLLPASTGGYQVSSTLTNSRGGIHIKGESGAKIMWTGADAGLLFDFGVLGSLTYRYTLSGFAVYGVGSALDKPHVFRFTQVSEFNTDALAFFDVRDVYTLNRANIGFITDQYCFKPDNFIVGAQTATAVDFGISNGQIFMDKLNVYSCSGHFCDVRSGIFSSLTITNSWIEQFNHLINVAKNGTDVTSFGLARLRLENLDVATFNRLIYAYGSADAVINPFFYSLDINRIYAANKTGSLPWIEINKNGNTHVSSAYGKEINLSSIELQSSTLSSGVLNITGGTPLARFLSVQMETPGPLLVGTGTPIEMPKTDFAPVWASTGTQPVIGNGVLGCTYTVEAGVVRLSLLLFVGATTTIGTGNYTFSLPFAAAVDSSALGLGSALLVSSGGTVFNHGSALIDSAGATMTLYFASSSWSATTPVGLLSGDVLRVNVSYRVA